MAATFKTLDDFKAFCKAYDEDGPGDEFDENNLTLEPYGAHYRTIFRDEANYKVIMHLNWHQDTGEIGWDCEYPEASDVMSNLLNEFAPPGERSYTVYLKLDVKADSLDEAIKMAEKLLVDQKGMKGEAFGDARTAQFG